MSSSYRQSLEQWLKGLDVSAGTVLDIGGAQLPVDARCGSWNVDNYIIHDLSEPHDQRATPHYMGDLNYPFDTFPLADIVFCLEVMEYIWNPVTALTNIQRCLAEEGIAYVTFPFVYPYHQPVDFDYLRYTPSGILKLAFESGLQVVSMLPRRPISTMLPAFYGMERLRAAKGFDHNVMGFIATLERL